MASNFSRDLFKNLDVDEFNSTLGKELSHHRDLVHKYYAGKVEKVFRELIYPSESVKRRAEEFLEGSGIFPRPNGPKNKKYMKEKEEAETIKDHCQKSLQRKHLLFYGPLKEDSEISHQESHNKREAEYLDFCKYMPEIKSGNYETIPVYKREELFASIKTHMEKHKESGEIFIVFNGHGTEDFKLVLEDLEGANEYVTLDEFINKVDEFRSRDPPQLVIVVFAQCYGHGYTKPTPDGVDVISFTNDNKPNTTSDGGPGTNYKYFHVELHEYAQQQAAEVNIAYPSSSSKPSQPEPMDTSSVEEVYDL